MHCPLLNIPVELRLQIYDLALTDNPIITIGTAEVVGSHPDIIHKLYGGKRNAFPGIPYNHEPVVVTGYHESLLSVTKPGVIPASTPKDEQAYEHTYTAHLALLLVSKQINDELTSHFKLSHSKSPSLFISYPYGLHVCRTLTPHLIRRARSVHIAGTYVSRTFCPARAACMGPIERGSELDVKTHGNVILDTAEQLGDLIRSMFGPESANQIQKLELRIYYSGDDSYSTVWGDESSPTVIALRNIYAGEVGIEVWRGRSTGTGVFLTARPSAVPAYVPAAEAEKLRVRRVVSTVWRRLEEGRRGEAEEGSWVVDLRWPKWDGDD